jgi:hypothetical protein
MGLSNVIGGFVPRRMDRRKMKRRREVGKRSSI